LFNFFKKQYCKIEHQDIDNTYKSIYGTDSEIFYKFYQECCPVFNAINLVVDTCASINLSVKDKLQNELVDHSVLELLKKPNPFTDGKTFLKEFLREYLVTGNAYININKVGNTTELTIISDTDIAITNNLQDNFPATYIYNGGRTYSRTADNKFIDKIGNQIIHLRNSKIKQRDIKGSSFLLGAQLEMNQYLEASIHNNSLLRNQCKPSKIIAIKGQMTANAISQLRDIFKKHSGSQATGTNLVIPHDIDIKDASISMQDLDFKNLKRDCEIAIEKCLKIPLALVVAENMTLSNLESSIPIFYDNAILPLLDNYICFLNNNLMPLFDRNNQLEFTIDISQIRPLKQRLVDDTIKVYSNNLITRNEARAEIGKEDSNGGDIFYQPQNLVAVGNDNFTTDNRQTSQKSFFINKMKEIKLANGERLYNDDEIKHNADRLFHN
jgi:HK97 family phage portal protein